MKAKSSATVSPPRVQRAQRRPTQIVRVFVFIPLALLATLGGFAVSKAGGTRNSLPAGMSVAKIAIGGKRLEEVRALLEKFAEEHANTPVVFSIPNEGSTPRSWKSLAKETGLLVDVEATLADIAKMGEIGLLERMRNLFVTPTGQTISVRTRVEEDKLTQRLKRIQKIVNREPKNPRLDITQTPYAILPGKQGFTLDVPPKTKKNT